MTTELEALNELKNYLESSIVEDLRILKNSKYYHPNNIREVKSKVNTTQDMIDKIEQMIKDIDLV